MTKRQYRNYSLLFFFFSAAFFGFFIHAVIYGTGISRLISSLLFGFLVVMQLRVALTMRRNYKNLDLK